MSGIRVGSAQRCLLQTIYPGAQGITLDIHVGVPTNNITVAGGDHSIHA